MKYCLYADENWLKNSYSLNPELSSPISHKQLPPIMHSGLTNWARVFDGVFDMPLTPDQYGKYEVLHMNVTPNSVGNIYRVRRHLDEMDNPPLLVVNIDHAIDMWAGFKRFDIFLEELKMVDRVFCVEERAANTLQFLLNKKVYHINHPTDVKTLQEKYGSNRKDDPFPYKTVLVIAHPYDRNYLIATWSLLELRKQHDDLRVLLVGQIEDNHAFLRKHYDEFYYATPFTMLMEVVSRVDCVIDTAVTHCGGRVPAECAAVGTPCVGGRNIDTIHKYHRRWEADIFNADQLSVLVADAVYNDGIPMIPDGYDQSRKLFEEMVNG